MKYSFVVEGRFVARPNRFIAHVELDGKIETVHVKNTGRCRELLVPECRVILAKADNPHRKTQYDLVAVYKAGLGLVNMDSQAPNRVVAEWLSTQGYDYVKPEYAYGNSRVDFYMEKANAAGVVEQYLMEVKGCTLELDGIGYFPDAPTERGVKHLRELAKAAVEGYHATLAYVIQMEGVQEVRPNVSTHPEYGEAVAMAREAGVRILFLGTEVQPDELKISWSRYL